MSGGLGYTSLASVGRDIPTSDRWTFRLGSELKMSCVIRGGKKFSFFMVKYINDDDRRGTISNISFHI